MVPPGFPGPVNPLRLRGRRAAALLSQSSYNLSHISTPSSFQPQSLVAGKRPFFPTQSCWQVQHCSHPLWTSHPDPGGGTDQDLLLLPPPKPPPPPPLPQSQHPTPLSSRPSTSSTPYLHSAPCRTHHPAHKTRNPRASTKKTSAPTPSAGSLPQPGRGSPVVSPSAQPLSSHHSKTAGSISDVTCTRCWPKGYPAKC